MIDYQTVENHPLIGQVFTDHVQPYGTRKMVIESVAIAGEPMPSYAVRFPIGPQMTMMLTGTVIEGTERSKLFGARTYRDITGARHTVYGVKWYDLEKMEKVTVCM